MEKHEAMDNQIIIVLSIFSLAIIITIILSKSLFEE